MPNTVDFYKQKHTYFIYSKKAEILSNWRKMIVRKILLMMRRNSMTLLGAAILASGIFYVVNNPDVFMASILSLQEKEFIMEQ